MLFNSLTFIVFFIVVYAIYLFLYRHKKPQNIILLVASYVFYGYWDYKYLGLIWLVTLVSFYCALHIGRVTDRSQEGKRKRKLLLAANVVFSLGVLCVFKYFNFFMDGAADLFNLLGLKMNPVTLNLLLPVGISFFTFQSIGYVVDVYKKRLEPCEDLIDFALFVAFFPQLVAGPIERAKNLLPQMQRPRSITMGGINAGLYLLLWGYFKKMVIADNLGLLSDQIFNNYGEYSGLDLVLGGLAFTFQIYCDFSGYSDVARGLSKLMGFELMINFKLPFFAINPTDFWRRWHISLSTWLRDYLYIPLGGNRKGSLNTYRNLMITMLLGGLWHGAAWNFVLWGAYHGILLALYRRFERRPAIAAPWSGEYSRLVTCLKMAAMFFFALVGWVIFRSGSAHQIMYMFSNASLLASDGTAALAWEIAFYAVPLLAVQVAQYVSQDLNVICNSSPIIRIPVYGLLFVGIAVFGVRESPEFIYFQF